MQHVHAIFYSACLLVLTGCSGSLYDSSDARLAAYEGDRVNYLRCAYTATDSINARTPRQDARIVAIAAKAACSREAVTLMDAVMRSHNPEIVPRIMQTYEDGFIEASIARSVNTASRR